MIYCFYVFIRRLSDELSKTEIRFIVCTISTCLNLFCTVGAIHLCFDATHFITLLSGCSTNIRTCNASISRYHICILYKYIWHTDNSIQLHPHIADSYRELPTGCALKNLTRCGINKWQLSFAVKFCWCHFYKSINQHWFRLRFDATGHMLMW